MRQLSAVVVEGDEGLGSGGVLPAQGAHGRGQGVRLHLRRLVVDLVLAADFVEQDDLAQVVQGLRLPGGEDVAVLLVLEDVLDLGGLLQEHPVVVLATAGG